jgi:hypothetical protein
MSFLSIDALEEPVGKCGVDKHADEPSASYGDVPGR